MGKLFLGKTKILVLSYPVHKAYFGKIKLSKNFDTPRLREKSIKNDTYEVQLERKNTNRF